MTSVVIVGAGIIGMTTAVCLLRKGFDVTVLTKDDLFKTNSDAAVATWYTPEKDKPLLQRLCLESLSTWYELSQHSETGVKIIPMVYYFKDDKDFQDSIWSTNKLREQLRITTHIPEKYMRSEEFKTRVLAEIPLIDPSIYRPYLFRQFQNLKGNLKIQKVETLTSLADHYDIVLNCAGWEAKYLTRDHRIYPVRGQVEIFKVDEKLEILYSVNIRDKDSYLVFRPQSRTYAIGTTYQVNDTSSSPCQQDKEATLDKIASFIPIPIINASTHSHSQVGIRCGRSDVRLEDELIKSPSGKETLLVHCYGHGGSGFSAAWGSAAYVLEQCLDYCAGKRNTYQRTYSCL